MSKKKYNKNGLVALVLVTLLWAPQGFAAQSNKDFTLFDGSADSPQLILVDGDNKKLIIQKLDAGNATVFNDEGNICMLPSNDADDYICFVTASNLPAIMWSGINDTEPGIQVSSAGKLQYRNSAGTWADFDSLSSASSTSLYSANGTLTANRTITMDGKKLTFDGTGDLVINDDGNLTTGGSISGADITATGDVTVGNAKSVKLSDDDGSNTVALKAPAAVTADVTLTLPDGAGTSGQVLQTDGSGILSWTAPGAAAISDGDLTAAKTAVDNGRIIVGNADGQGAAVAMSGDVTISNTGATSIAAGVVVDADVSGSAAIAGSKIAPNFVAQNVETTGSISGADITATGDVTVDNAKSVKLAELDSNGSHTMALKAPDSVTADVTLTLPDGAGTSGQVLQTNGSGVLSWTTPAPAYYATGVLASFGYHTDDCNGTAEKFIQYATVSSVNYGLCVEKVQRGSDQWGDASNTCKILGKRLPDYDEWRKACDGQTSGPAGTTDIFFTSIVGNWEWASSRPAAVSHGSGTTGAGSIVAGDSSCGSVSWSWVRRYDGSESSYPFRCVR